ncbi:Zfp407 [Phodopus roborovskii]|uniref:Zfp407 protein n=1 Tax=Phodopus roborovskii TaxID=109678 RepID=A0AAV0A342_PHORO|nr:Zfp407 [Phodopus roborovskii]
MDSDNKHENDEDEEATDIKSVSSRDASCGPVSDGIAITSENFTNKRGLSESSSLDSVAVEEDGSALASKRMRIEAEEPLETGEQGTCGLDIAEVSVHSAEARKETFSANSSDGGRSLPSDFSPSSDFSTFETLPLKAVRRPAQEMVSLVPEGHTPFPPEEMSVSCSFGNAETVLQCSTCGHSCASCSALEEHVECHVEQDKECACCRCSRRAEGSSCPHVHVKHTHGAQKVFSCDLCGFQCADENLLNAHYLGKTHLRRQNLAARGGFVQILTKQPFPKKTCVMGTKNVRTKPRASKPIARGGDSKGVQNTGSKFKDCRGAPSEQTGEGSELLVQMVPSRVTSSGRGEIVEENAALGIIQNPEYQDKQLRGLVSSEGLIGKSESIRNTLQIAHISISTTSRPKSERNVLMLGSSFRRRSGTFTLKGQAKKRYNLLGINKRGANETQRMYMKHLRTQMKTNGVQSMAEQIHLSKDVQSLCVTASGDPEAMSDKATADRQVLCTSPECGHRAADKTDLEVHVKGCHAREVQSHCQTCNFSSPSQKDLEEHLHSSQHQSVTPALSCQCCSFISLSESSLREHMKESHSMGFFCTSCNLFLSEKDVEEHRATEMHSSLVVQPKMASVSASCTVESENTGGSRAESGEAAKADPAESRVSHGTEARHSSKPQFQCKKCFYKTRSSTVLTRHIKLRHGQDYHFLCKACNLYSLSKEGMEKHIKRSKHLENAKKNNIGLSFEECIERVCIGANDKREECDIPGSGVPEGHAGARLQEHSHREQGSLTPKELPQSGVITKDDELALATTPKRGRPKGSVSRTCSHCGLLASSITNLTVHIRRKHSHQYSYLCKVCKYYTVTKGDMERHCATKKHKGRVETEANGKQSSDIIVGPEGGNLEACKKNTPPAVTVSDECANKSAESDALTLDKPVVDCASAGEVEAENTFHSVDGEGSSRHSHKRGQVPLETEVLLQQMDACSQRDAAGSGDNKCMHCEFSAHSAASLDLHVKRKHTKDFQFYCMACDYYAVTRREMTRHAATEKHKMKRQSYLSSSNAEADSSEMSKSILITEEEHSQSPEEFKVAPDQSHATLRSGNAAGCSAVDESTGLDVSKALCDADSVEIVTEEDHSFCETLQQPLVKDKSMKPREIVSLSTHSNHGFPGCLQSEDPGSCAVACEAAKTNHGMLSDVGDPSARCEDEGCSADGSGGKVLNKSLCSGDLDGGHSAESTSSVVLKIPREQLPLDGGGQNKVGSEQSSEGLKDAEKKAVLINSHHGTEIVLEEDGPASDDTVDSNDVYETIISIDDKGQTMYSVGRFDSSIIRIKTSEDGELADQSEEGLMATGARVSELPLKDGAQGLKRRKVEGSSLGESTRIRCDDCGFLADGLSGLNVHIAMKHPTKEKHFHCLLCGKSFYTESNLHQHLASAGHMRNEQASVEELPEGGATFKCVKCTEPFDSEQNLFLHIKGQHEELLREVNKYIVEDTEQINREREENQGNVCKYCGKMCRSSNSMAFLAHIRTHTGSKPFKCKICHFATAQLGDARNHVKRHLGMREYKCHCIIGHSGVGCKVNEDGPLPWAIHDRLEKEFCSAEFRCRGQVRGYLCFMSAVFKIIYFVYACDCCVHMLWGLGEYLVVELLSSMCKGRINSQHPTPHMKLITTDRYSKCAVTHLNSVAGPPGAWLLILIIPFCSPSSALCCACLLHCFDFTHCLPRLISVACDSVQPACSHYRLYPIFVKTDCGKACLPLPLIPCIRPSPFLLFLL